MAKNQSPSTSSNPISAGIGYIKESWAEIKKVHFPTKAETVQSTFGVLFLIFLFVLFLGLTDHIVGKVMQEIMT